VVVLDVNLPDINGFEVCRRIKAHPGTRAIPVLHLSGAHASSQDVSHGLDEGADGYLTKPVEPDEFIAHIKALVRIHQAEEQTRAVAREWQATFDAIRDGVCLLDGQGRVVRCNQALGRLLGREPDALLGRPHHEIIAGEMTPPENTPFARMLATGRREVAELSLGGRWLQAVADPLPAAGGGVAGAVYVLSDVTERKHLEEQLRHAQKMEAVGRLAGGVAHDFNNLLTGILGNVSLLVSGTPKTDPRYPILQVIEQTGWRAAELVRQLLGFSRRTVLYLRPTDLRQPIKEVTGILQRTIDPRVRVEVRLADDLLPVQADPAQLNQVLMNLCLNACDAMPEGGQLLLEAENVKLDEEYARLHVGARPGSFVRLRVSDTGHGIPPEVLPRIFEPFFTTKEPGKGTGLGLAMVFGIVELHQGWVACESTPGQGTRFDIYLPSDGATAAGAPAPAPEARAGRETILLVDDDAAIRDLGRTWLSRRGYQVLLAEDGLKAVEIYQREQARIDLVVLDVRMPRLSGRETLVQLRRLDPNVRVIFASGFPGEQVPEVGTEGVLGFVGKPYREEDIVTAIRTALDRGKPETHAGA
jgi:PAS domain S-box-containing protein